MFAVLHALGMFVSDIFKSRRRLQAENLFLRHQLNIALRRAPPRPRLRGIDRALLVWMILGEARLSRILQRYADYYNKIRTHRSLDKDAPVFRSTQRVGSITSRAILGGLPHQYVRI
jgi:hypothetical protein